MSAPLVILYHREPYDEIIENGQPRYVQKRKPNGIVPTLKSFLDNSPNAKWIAWKQIPSRAMGKFQTRVEVKGPKGTCVVHRVPLSGDQVKNFYHITSKEAFWPILHSFPWQFSYDSSDWENFAEINRLFAEAAVEDTDDDCVFWIHDYNLWLTPQYIRALKPRARIIFFHHTPFPGPDIFCVLPWRDAIIESLLACDLCGFHVPRYAQNFVATARALKSIEILDEGPVDPAFAGGGHAMAEPEMVRKVRHNGREVYIDAFPVGTNPQQISSILESPKAQDKVREIRNEVGDRRLILAAGRIDYTKGMKEMLLCFERLLTRRPELIGKVNLILSAVAPAEGMQVYKQARAIIEQLVGRINGQFQRLSWTPVVLFTQGIPFEDLLPYMKAADIAWITPLRDGLNLVAKEYIVAKGGESGVLILSEFVGSAVQLSGAVLTNPYASTSMDQAIDQALAMPETEQKLRMKPMYDSMLAYDVQRWASRMFSSNGIAREIAAEVAL